MSPNINVKLTGDRELSLYLGKVSRSIKPQAVLGLEEIGKHLQEKVKDKFGHYQQSWPKLKRASVIAKYRRRSLKGMGIGGRKMASFSVSSDDPLVLFGNLQKSIDRDLNSGALEVTVFSDNPYAAVHEYGYGPKGVPARSYMRLTLSQEENEIVDIMGKNIGRSI